jgi:hypothetical protein
MRLSKRGAIFSLASGAALLCLCCEGVAQREAATPQTPLPSYDGRATQLFDDMIDPAAVGYGGSLIGTEQGRSPKDDALLRERTQSGDAVVRARVVTVTSGADGQDSGWQIGLRTLETVAGKKPLEGEFSFFVASKGPAAGVVRMLDARLVGSTFVVFVRAFEADGEAGAGPGSALHFHFAKDDKDELGAVREASLLGEVR